MKINLDILQDAVEAGHSTLVSEVLVQTGKAVLSGEHIVVESQATPCILCNFSDYESWLNRHFQQLLRA